MATSTRLAMSGLLAATLAAGCGGGSVDGGGAGGGGLPTEPVVPAPAGPAPRDESDWTFCSNAGEPCNFFGLRDVRLGGANGPYVYQTEYGGIPCAVYGFGGRDPGASGPLHCDYSPIKTATLSNPQPGMAGLPATVRVPLGAPGSSDARVQEGYGTPVFTDGSGAFRTTCSLAKFDFMDPIVYPNQNNASHLHIFYGSVGVNAGSTPESLKQSGPSTCRGGSLNRTAYWMPAVVDMRTGAAVTPEEGVFYYKTGYNVDPRTVQTIPAGLRMIAGDKNATGPQEFLGWACRDSGEEPPDGSIPNCPVGDVVRFIVIFPQCWDGRNLDSPDHKSHMAYPAYRNRPERSSCPPSHPVTLPEITEHFDFPVTAGSSPAHWRLSSDMYDASRKGGLSAHADWMNGWDATTLSTIVTQCLNRALDCGVGSIGNGRALF